jgi:hypothetical protein
MINTLEVKLVALKRFRDDFGVFADPEREPAAWQEYLNRTYADLTEAWVEGLFDHEEARA